MGQFVNMTKVLKDECSNNSKNGIWACGGSQGVGDSIRMTRPALPPAAP